MSEYQDLLRQQINNILAKLEDKSTVEAMINLAHSLTAFILECEADGLQRYEAIILAQKWMESLLRKSQSDE